MSNIIQDGNLHFLIEGGQVVAAAENPEALMERTAATCKECGEECADGSEYCKDCEKKMSSFAVGDRVEVAGRLGTVKTLITSVYGDVAGVKLDNGSVEEVLTDVLSHTKDDEPTYTSAVEALLSEFKTYEETGVAGIEDIQTKAAVARQLNLRAKAIVTDPKLSFSDRVSLDKLVLQTGVDIVELKEDEQALLVDDHIASLPRYEMEVGHSHPHPAEDASWLLEAAERVKEEKAATDWDAAFAIEAVDLVGRMSGALLEDETYLTETADEWYDHLAAGLEEKEAHKSKFHQLVRQAATDRQESLEKKTAQKVASVEVSDDTPDELLFL